MIDIEAGTIAVYSDIGCPWAHLCVFRLHRARRELGLEVAVRFDHRAFPLEIFNRQPTPKKILDAEISVAGALDPDAGWQMWQRPEHEYPVTTLPALEAVQAAKGQGLIASEQLDSALRVGLFGESRTISMRHEILDIADRCSEVDAVQLRAAIDAGRARRTVVEQQERARKGDVVGSPHIFAPGGLDVHNPGIEIEWEGEHGEGFPVVQSDDPAIYERILNQASEARGAEGE